MTRSILHKTLAGHEACKRVESQLPQDYRTILESVQYATHFDVVAARLAHCSQAQIVRRLKDLEAIGLIECVPVDWLRELYALDYCQLSTNFLAAPRAP